MRLRSILVLMFAAAPCAAQPLRISDRAGDAALRRLDLGADGAIDPATHRMPDILQYRLGGWEPDDAANDLYQGGWDDAAEFFRLDIVFDGLVNPPGSLGIEQPFDPFHYGDHPVFGYVEFDVDADVNTGGELDRPDLRYNGAVGRYGGAPRGSRFANRVAVDGRAFDGDVTSGPFVDLSGEDFHLALFGWLIEEVHVEHEGDPNDPNGGDPNIPGGDPIFGPGAVWRVTGRLLHRSHGYERFSYACCDGEPGSYEPEVTLRFRHRIDVDRTTVSFVYPLTNVASAAMRDDENVEPDDGDASNQNSIVEALDDLAFSAEFAPPAWRADPAFRIIERWADWSPAMLRPTRAWRVAIAVGTSYTDQDPSGALLAWTDVYPDIVAGDFDADGRLDGGDLILFDDYMVANDGLPGFDADGLANGEIHLAGFGPNFSMFDVNYDGVIDAADRPIAGGGLQIESWLSHETPAHWP